MLLRQIGVLYKREYENNKPYYSGELDLGVLGRIRLAIFIQKFKKDPHDPDGFIQIELQEE